MTGGGRGRGRGRARSARRYSPDAVHDCGYQLAYLSSAYRGEAAQQERCEVGAYAMLVGGGFILVGTPLIVAGSWQVEASREGAPPTTAELRIGAARADVAVTF